MAFIESLVFKPPRPSYRQRDAAYVHVPHHGHMAYRVYESDPDAPSLEMVIVYSHGNASDIGWKIQSQFCGGLVECLREKNISARLYAYDYCKYGCSTHEDIEHTKTTCAIACAEAMYWTAKKSHPSAKMVLLGHSVGTGVTCELAKRLLTDTHTPSQIEPTVDQIILISAFVSTMSVAAFWLRHFGWADAYDNMAALNTIANKKVHTVLIHGRDDPDIPYTHSEYLCANYEGTSKVVTVFSGCNHNSIIQSREPIERVALFMASQVHQDRVSASLLDFIDDSS